MRQLLIFFILTFSISARALAPSHQVLISTTDQEKHNPQWAEQMCLHAFNSLQAAAPVSSTCFDIDRREISVAFDPRVQKIRAEGTSQLYLHIHRVDEKETWVRIVNFRSGEDALDFKDVTVYFHGGDAQNEISVQRLAKNLSYYLVNKEAFKTRLIAEGIHHSKDLSETKDGRVVRTLDGTALSPKEAYNIFKAESVTTKAYIQSSLELAAIFGFALYKYHQIESNRADQDFPGSYWTNLKLKLTGRISGTDDNNSAANIGHVGAGVVYYEIFRSTGRNALESTLFTLASSAAWEYAFEYKEIMSKNDMVSTGIAGAAAGEVLHKMALAIRNKNNSWLGKTLAAVINPIGSFNDAVAGWTGQPRVYPRLVGELDARLFSQFELKFGWIQIDRGGSEKISAMNMGLNADVYEIGLFHEQGKVKTLLLNAPRSKFELEFSQSKFGIEDFRFLTKQVMAAYYKKNLERDQNAELRGFELLVGAGASFEWEQTRSRPLYFEEAADLAKDMIANTHVAEGTVEAFGFYKGIRFQLALEIAGDFAMVRNLSLDDFTAAKGSQGLLSVVKRRGYYYGAGWTHGASLEVGYGRLAFQLYGADTRLNKSNWYHRQQELATENVSISDRRVRLGSAVTVLISKTASASFYCALKDRRSRFAEFSKTAKAKECGTRLKYIF